MAEVNSPGLSVVQVKALIDQALAAAATGVTQAQVNSTVSSAIGALAIPQPASAAPPAVADASAKGTQDTLYALANHTHASKVRKVRAQTAADGTLTWTFNPAFASGVVPIVIASAQAAPGVTDVINVQTIGDPTNTSCQLLVNRTQRSAVALLGLTILSVPSNPGATLINAIAFEP